MKKILSILLTLIMLAGMLAIVTVTASAAVKTTDAAFTDNFVLLDYIENTNGQYINTGYKAGKDVTVSVNLEITAWNHDYAGIFGSRSDNHSANSFVMCRDNGNNGERTEIGSNNHTTLSVGLNTRSELSLSGSNKFSGTGLEIYLFGVNQDDSLETTNWGSATYRLYSCKITDDGEVKRDFVPAQQKSSGVVGLYDLQNGKFYKSASGTGFAMTTVKFPSSCSAAIGYTGYNSLAAAVNAANAGDTVQLLSDCKLSKKITVGNTMTVDLCGHTVTGNFESSSMFRVTGENVQLTLTSSKDYGVGTLTCGKKYNLSGVCVDKNAVLILERVVITDSEEHGLGGGAGVSGTMIMKAGSMIKDCWAHDGGGAVYLKDGGNLIMESGSELSGCSADNDGYYGDGGAVKVSTNSGFTMKSGAKITGSKSCYGGGVYVYKGKFTMESGSEISGCESGYYGGGVYLDDCSTFTMETGAKICDNSALFGGGVYVYGGTANLSGSITGCTATYGYGGVLHDGSIKLSGAPYIYDNYVGTARSDLYLPNNRTFSVENLTDGAKIGILTEKTPSSDSEPIKIANVPSDCSQYFVSDKGDGFSVAYNDGDLVVKIAEQSVGSVLSEGNLWIIVAVAVLAIGGVATLAIVKKKKKPATANGASTENEE